MTPGATGATVTIESLLNKLQGNARGKNTKHLFENITPNAKANENQLKELFFIKELIFLMIVYKFSFSLFIFLYACF